MHWEKNKQTTEGTYGQIGVHLVVVDVVGHVLDLGIIGLVSRGRSRSPKGSHSGELGDTGSNRTAGLEGVEGDERRPGDGGDARLESAGGPGGQPS